MYFSNRGLVEAVTRKLGLGIRLSEHRNSMYTVHLCEVLQTFRMGPGRQHKLQPHRREHAVHKEFCAPEGVGAAMDDHSDSPYFGDQIGKRTSPQQTIGIGGKCILFDVEDGAPDATILQSRRSCQF